MVKLKMLSMHKVENVPDHVLQEMQEFATNLTMSIQPIIESVSPNIALCGLNWMCAVMLKHLITNNPEELRKAAKMSCSMILNNMEILIAQMENEDEK
jgi:hypothetical protein